MYLEANYNVATRHYIKASKMMRANHLGVPSLVMFSQNDPISTPEMNERVYSLWEKKGLPVRKFQNSI